jgi:glucosamine kinase
MGLIIGIDGGGSGCRALVADANGVVLGQADSGPANIATDPDGALRSILHCAETAFRQAVGANASAEMRQARAGLGLAGANARGAAERLAASLPFARCRIETDALTAARGALGLDDGIVAALGTGSVFVRQQDRTLRQFGGWGIVLGDEGSGASLGRAALARAVLAVDGRVPMTPYLTRLLDQNGGPDGVVLLSLTARPADLARMAPDIIASDDPACRALWAKSVSDVAEMLAFLRADAPLPVTFVGGLGTVTAAALPDLPQRPAKGSALDGALLLARGIV